MVGSNNAGSRSPRALRERALVLALDVGDDDKAISDMLAHLQRRLAASRVRTREVHRLLREAQRMEDDEAIKPGFDSHVEVAA